MDKRITKYNVKNMTIQEMKDFFGTHCIYFDQDYENSADNSDIILFETFLIVTELFKRIEELEE